MACWSSNCNLLYNLAYMTIQQATALSNRILSKLGFSVDEAKLITQNLIEAELVEKSTHGLVRLPAIAKHVSAGKIKTTNQGLKVIAEHPASIHFDAGFKPGFCAIYQSLERAFDKVTHTGILAVAIKDMAYASGYIGDYARRAAERDLIYLGFHNSPGGLVPFGAAKNLWGTNPVTIGVSSKSIPVILDMAPSQCTWGDLLVAQTEGKNIPPDLAIDGAGRMTTDPTQAMLGGILPIAGHKGSGLALMVELLAGGLSQSRVGSAVDGGWGAFYVLIDPRLFRELDDFKSDVQQAIDELKTAPKAPGVKEIFFPGEQTYYKRKKNLAADHIELSSNLLNDLEKLS